MGIFYPLMKKAGYGLPGEDAVVVWWGALRAIGLALALVVYSEHLRYDFSISDGGTGYREETTSVLILDKGKASFGIKGKCELVRRKSSVMPQLTSKKENSRNLSRC